MPTGAAATDDAAANSISMDDAATEASESKAALEEQDGNALDDALGDEQFDAFDGRMQAQEIDPDPYSR